MAPRPFRRASERHGRWVVALLLAVSTPAMLATTRSSAAPKGKVSVAAAASASASASVLAGPSAADIKARGDAAFDALLYEDALRAYQEAYALSADPALLYNQAQALKALGRYPQALAMFERFGTDAPPALLARVPGLSKLVAEVRARVAVLRVACNVDGAQVIVGDRVIGETGKLGEVALDAGSVTLVVQREGYFPVRRPVQLVGGGTTAIDVELLPRATAGVLSVIVEPPAARVTIDGKFQGDAPIELVLPAGTHDVALSSPGYEPLSSKAVVAADARGEVRLTMQATPSITSRWWFWTGVGVVVVGGVALTIALTTDRAPPTGSFSPGRVSAPLGVRF